jgi:hypothetical protein
MSSILLILLIAGFLQATNGWIISPDNKEPRILSEITAVKLLPTEKKEPRILSSVAP